MVSLRPCTLLTLGMMLLGWSQSAGHSADSGSEGCGTCRDLQVVVYGRCWKGEVSGSRCMSGSFRFQSSDLVELCNKSCCFIIFAGRPSVSQGASDSDDLFNLADVHVTTVDVVTDSGDGRNNSSVGGGVIGEGDGCLHPTEWCLNGGFTMWNCR